ncbi:MAG: Flp family type IVb pilin [Pseudomonadota bacterium]
MSEGYKSIQNALGLLLKDERGATTIEYTLIVGILGTVLITAFGAIGEKMRDDIFGRIASVLNAILAST